LSTAAAQTTIAKNHALPVRSDLRNVPSANISIIRNSSSNTSCA
jgi:hypothetical protein